MDFNDSPDGAAFRAQARAWIAAHAPEQLLAGLQAAAAQTTSSVHPPEIEGQDPVAISKSWQQSKADGGWACLHWPVQYGGRGASPIQRVIWQQEEGLYAQLSNLFVVGHGMAGPTLIAHGTQAQKERYLKPIVSGAQVWCQLFSEPSGGSDLAGLRSRASFEGGHWIVNGQKIWTTHAQMADYGLLLVRTDPTVAKHEGLTMFLIDMKAPGVQVRPIRQMTGEHHFNEVFFTDVRLGDDCRIGPVGGGWRVGLTTLMNERLQLAAAIPTGVAEFFALCCELDTPTGKPIDDPAVRARLASAIARQRGLQWTMMRTLSALSGGKPPGPENSIGKLVAGDIAQDLCALALDLHGPAGAVFDEHGGQQRSFQKMLLTAASIRVGGGTAEIQRNILAEQVLGLPPDLRADKGMPFNKIPTGKR
jgi:alkylation response protein AidB-like acyl-CoA dehydrogenase